MQSNVSELKAAVHNLIECLDKKSATGSQLIGSKLGNFAASSSVRGSALGYRVPLVNIDHELHDLTLSTGE